MLQFCASTSVHHLLRLMPPNLVQGFALQHHDAIHKGTADKLTDIQHEQVSLPEYEGGMSMVSSYEVLNPAYAGAAAAVIPKVLYKVLQSTPQAVVAAMEDLNQLFALHASRVKVKRLDSQLPNSSPTQSQLPKAVHRIRDDELEGGLAAESSAPASWFASCRLRGSGSWLRALPVHACMLVSGFPVTCTGSCYVCE